MGGGLSGRPPGAVLPREFFDGPAPEVAPRLLGCVLRRDSPEGPVAAVITDVPDRALALRDHERLTR